MSSFFVGITTLFTVLGSVALAAILSVTLSKKENASTPPENQVGSAYFNSLDGSQFAYLEASPIHFQQDNENLTIEFYVRDNVPENSLRTWFSYFFETFNFGIAVSNNGTPTLFFVFYGTDYNTEIVYPNNTWCHLIFQYYPAIGKMEVSLKDVLTGDNLGYSQLQDQNLGRNPQNGTVNLCKKFYSQDDWGELPFSCNMYNLRISSGILSNDLANYVPTGPPLEVLENTVFFLSTDSNTFLQDAVPDSQVTIQTSGIVEFDATNYPAT
jgi:hypothetical protein